MGHREPTCVKTPGGTDPKQHLRKRGRRLRGPSAGGCHEPGVLTHAVETVPGPQGKGQRAFHDTPQHTRTHAHTHTRTHGPCPIHTVKGPGKNEGKKSTWRRGCPEMAASVNLHLSAGECGIDGKQVCTKRGIPPRRVSFGARSSTARRTSSSPSLVLY